MSKFLGKVGGFVADYGVVSKVDGGYVIDDYDDNVLFFCSDESIECADGQHYFLIEGKVCDHMHKDGQDVTILGDCDCTLVDRLDRISGAYFGRVGDEVELDNVCVSFRRSKLQEWKVTGEFSKLKKEADYRMVIEDGVHTFVLPYNSNKKVSFNDKYKYNVYAKVAGYAIEDGKRATVLSPKNVLKKGDIRLGQHWWPGIFRR